MTAAAPGDVSVWRAKAQSASGNLVLKPRARVPIWSALMLTTLDADVSAQA